MTTPTPEAIADTLAYYNCRRVNPKADDPIMGYHTFSEDQREFLRGVQSEAAAEIHRMFGAAAAQAKAEALAEVAEWEAEADASYKCAANLRTPVARNARTRLDRQEADRYEHHATIALNLAARMRETIEGKSE